MHQGFFVFLKLQGMIPGLCLSDLQYGSVGVNPDPSGPAANKTRE
ncbi:hypothetical protein [Methanosarcina sp. UBA5]|nr:hypothetical protein [Methanosarcina sp. UBA5]